MFRLQKILASFLAASAVFGFTACHQDSTPPTPLAAEQIPAELLRAYAKAKPEVMQIVTEINSSLQAKDYPTAFHSVEVLCNVPEANKDQRTTAVRAMLTINGLLQTAQAQGDTKATEALARYKALK
jgi:hypothetical protein